MSNQAQKEALQGIYTMLMHSGDISITVDCGLITPIFSPIAEANIIEVNRCFCDMHSFAENALDALSGNKEIVSDIAGVFDGWNFPEHEIGQSVMEFMRACIFEDATADVFSYEEMQEMLCKHPDHERLAVQDLIDNPAETDFYNAGELGFTA